MYSKRECRPLKTVRRTAQGNGGAGCHCASIRDLCALRILRVCRLIDVRYPPPADEGAVASRIPSAGAGTTAPRAVPHAQQQEPRRCGVKSSRRKSSSRRGRRPGGSVALGDARARAASWGAEEPTAPCPPPLGPETRLLRTALPQEEKGGGHDPERWKDCIPVGQHLPGTRFIAVKVPLKKVRSILSEIHMHRVEHWFSTLSHPIFPFL
ncbi:uncharacterized protein LOC130681141 [Manis pentadactyla]|uniref:uncharacterized protein LOC130681141 n=1 Tax=Manis pentadactyla TaxID=143292 RepID=UPI00255C36AE|nr:uncharacterized protein LOC130681141 [Manis pentadactyla]